jgi:hypothetical protein
MAIPRDITRFMVFLAAVAAVVIIMFATGSADDKAPPGSQGRGPVVDMATDAPR